MSWKYWSRVIVRNLGMLCILVLVWLHSHWSVGLSITLLSVAEEIRSIMDALRDEKEKLRGDIDRQVRDLFRGSVSGSR